MSAADETTNTGNGEKETGSSGVISGGRLMENLNEEDVNEKQNDNKKGDDNHDENETKHEMSTTLPPHGTVSAGHAPKPTTSILKQPSSNTLPSSPGVVVPRKRSSSLQSSDRNPTSDVDTETDPENKLEVSSRSSTPSSTTTSGSLLPNPNGTSTPRAPYPSYKVNQKSTSGSSSSNSSGLRPGGPSGPRRPSSSSPLSPSPSSSNSSLNSTAHGQRRLGPVPLPPLPPATSGSLNGVKRPPPAHYRHGSGGGGTERRPSPLNPSARSNSPVGLSPIEELKTPMSTMTSGTRASTIGTRASWLSVALPSPVSLLLGMKKQDTTVEEVRRSRVLG
ncbi:hypothetical protein K435DRAFT_434393 [Dendrothele bispora CBS 962.96]|uniref:Uncharacterized protein n=1 Tax=Dendrothele bispora (strain CBS 962.96) TaxID=1314807 RepID=A0A4S8MED7_DENBC|nr:hypothetical protein K435DRAFT_434393 [Dendrothele bispora CBS 962.96]